LNGNNITTLKLNKRELEGEVKIEKEINLEENKKSWRKTF